ncbi:MAG: ROK family protein [Cypionkella sp.]
MTQAALAFDLGGTDLRAALVTRDGAVRQALTVSTQATGGVAAILNQMTGLADQLLATEPKGEIAGIGIAAPGPLDPTAGLMIAPPTLPGWQDVPIARLLSERLGHPTVLDNDANMAALGEWRFGAGRGHTHVLFITVSTGIGGGLVSEGKIFQGRRGLAVEIGHMAIAETGPRCFCGSVGCFEALASGTALGHFGAAAAALPGGALIGQLQAEEGRPGARAVVEAARRGDAVAQSLIDQEARWLGVGITNLLHLYSPDVVVIGGGLSNAFDLLHGGILQVVQDRAMSAYRDVPILRAELGAKAGLVGAAALAFSKADLRRQT